MTLKIMTKHALRVFVTLLLLAFQAAAAQWTTDLPKAIAKAKEEKKLVFINFTGSDWCGWCKKLKAEVFVKPEFTEYADKNLVLVELDFPNSVPQSEALKKANQSLAKKYDISGYPTLVAVDGRGKEVWRNVGYLPGGPAAFIAKLDAVKPRN